MAMGGGSFTSQNKILPGIYINFISASRINPTITERGYVTFPLAMSWGKNGVTTLKVNEFEKKALELTGYEYFDEHNLPIREAFKHAHTIYLGRLNGGGVKARNTYGEAAFAGERGNELVTIISTNIDDTNKKDVSLYLGTTLVDNQTVADASELKDCAFFVYDKEATLEDTTGLHCTGGTDETVTVNHHQSYLNEIESYSFNALTVESSDTTIKGLYENFVKRMRDNIGIKFCSILYDRAADYEGVINLKTKAVEGDEKLVYWLAGFEAGIDINKSCGNKVYDGELTPIVDLTQEGLKDAILNGQLVFHKVGNEVRTLVDINSLTTTTKEKSEDFKQNQTIRTIDQIGNDMAVLFNVQYNDEVPNDQDGRITLWKDIVKLYNKYATKRAIQEVDSETIKVEPGEKKKSVVIDAPITVINCMNQAYMRVVVA